MAQHQYLFQLVKSLTPVEKRYFRLHSKSYFQNEKNGLLYEKLFNAIDKLPNGDISDSEFIQINKNAPFVANLNYQKNYLYELLTQTLRQQYTDKNSLDYYLPVLLIELRMFGEMGLVKHAIAASVKIINLCEITESYNYQVLACELISQVTTYQKRQKHKLLRDIEQRALEASLAAQAKQQCLVVSRILINTDKTPAQKAALAKQLSGFQKQFPHSFTIAEKAVLGLGHYYVEKHDYKSTIKVILEYCTLVEKSKAFHSKYFWTMQGGMGSYIVQLHNLSYAAFCNSQPDIVLQVIKEIKPIRQKAEQQGPPIPKADLFLFETKSKLQYALLKNEAYSHSDILTIEREIKRHKPYLPDHYIQPLYFLLSLYCLAGKKSSVAAKYCQEALSQIIDDNLPDTISRFEFEALAFLVLYREQETELMKYKLRNLQRAKQSKSETFKKYVLNILNGLYKGTPVAKLIAKALPHAKNGFRRELLRSIGKIERRT